MSFERLERQVRVDGAGAVAEQQRAVVHFARVARLDDQRAARALAEADQMMVHARGRQQAGDRRARAVGVAIGQDQDRVAGIDRARSRGGSGRRARARARDRPAPRSNSIGIRVVRKPGS